MALAAFKGYAHVVLTDYNGDKSVMRLDLHDTALADIAAAIADYMTAIGKLDPCTEAKITNVFIGTEYTDPGYGSADHNVEEQAVVSTKLANTAKYGILRIPAPAAGIFLAGPGPDSNKLDVGDADLIAWLNEFYASGGNKFKTSDGETLANPATTGNWKGRRVFRHSRKRLPRSA
jgi:hypothetical protein